MNLESMMLSERSQSQKTILYNIIYGILKCPDIEKKWLVAARTGGKGIRYDS